MRFSYRWFRNYLQSDLSFEDFCKTITMVGLEVEEVLDLGLAGGKVVVGEIVELAKHPQADKLSVCRVRASADGEPLQIVCGAQNIAVGQRVPLALVGATLPNGMTLKPTKIRGVDSAGMMCSAKELGVGADSDGIWIQPEDLPVGEAFDALVTIKVTPNRPDALSLTGLARDVAARTAGKVVVREVTFKEADERAENAVRITVDAREDCPRYAARVVGGVKVGPSPLWLQRRLESAGLRPINNVVDVTNYVMLELGHPLHAFDMGKVAGKHVVVRHAKAGEKLTLLDNTMAALVAGDLVIADAEKALALAGIMGGASSAISEGTTTVLIESAWFRPTTIRKTAKRLAKSTDASYRFERGADPKRVLTALHRTAQLIAELSGGQVLKGHLDVCGKLPETEPITIRLERLKLLTGLSLTGREVSDILLRLGFEVTRTTEKELTVAVPSFRPDVTMEADLIEEVARIHGYDRIVALLPPIEAAAPVEQPERRLARALADEMTALGFHEAINFSFVDEAANKLAGLGDDGRVVGVRNPLSRDQAVMRRSVVPSLLANVRHNLNQGVESIRLFEIGRTYAWRTAAVETEMDPRSPVSPAAEQTVMALVMAGGLQTDWRSAGRAFDFFDVKGVGQAIIERLGLTRVVVEPLRDHAMLHPGRAAALIKGGQRLCVFGELHPAIAKELDFRPRVMVLEMVLNAELLALVEVPKYRELPRTPPAKRDIALLVSKETSALEIERTLKSAGGELLASSRVFDVYEGDKVPEGKKSIAFALTFRDPDPEATLTDDKVVAAMAKITEALEKKTGATLRA